MSFRSKISNSLNSCKKFSGSVIHGLSSERGGKSDLWLAQHHNRFRNDTCFVLGNGPSLNEVSNDILDKFPVFGTNGIYLKYTPTYYVTISVEFYKNHISGISKLACNRKFIGGELLHAFPDFEGSILNCGWNVYAKLGPIAFPVPLKFSKRADRIVYLGGSVLFVCLQIAYFMRFRRVILLGVDHSFGFSRSEAAYGGKRIQVEGKDEIHFDSNYNPHKHSMHCDMIATERSFELALSAFQKDGREILKATPNTGLDVIPRANLADLL